VRVQSRSRSAHPIAPLQTRRSIGAPVMMKPSNLRSRTSGPPPSLLARSRSLSLGVFLWSVCRQPKIHDHGSSSTCSGEAPHCRRDRAQVVRAACSALDLTCSRYMTGIRLSFSHSAHLQRAISIMHPSRLMNRHGPLAQHIAGGQSIGILIGIAVLPILLTIA